MNLRTPYPLWLMRSVRMYSPAASGGRVRDGVAVVACPFEAPYKQGLRVVGLIPCITGS